jgi:NAD(P)-dependent dehydrogenase (short-subunit alcohol dehydrogenase family)
MAKTVLITGAAEGIGRATVETFVRAGWQVVAVDQKEAESFPHGVLYAREDISAPTALAGLYDWLSDEVDQLHALVHNAAIQVTKPLLETTLEEWDQVFNVNLRSVFISTRLAHPLLKAAGGAAVVNVSSVHALATSENIAAYAASKGGLLALTRAMAIEFAKDQIRVNAILPGAVDTAMLRSGLSRGHLDRADEMAQLRELREKIVMGRIGQPQEIARAIYFLVDNDLSSYMTGQALIVDGGAVSRLSTE